MRTSRVVGGKVLYHRIESVDRLGRVEGNLTIMPIPPVNGGLPGGSMDCLGAEPAVSLEATFVQNLSQLAWFGSGHVRVDRPRFCHQSSDAFRLGH